MTRSLGWSAALLCIFTLACSHSLSAKAGGTLVQANVQSAALLNAATSAFPLQALNIWTTSNYVLDDGGYKPDDKEKDWNKGWWYGDGGWDKDDHDHHRHRHEPTPEPSTLLSFAAAILIGGGVLYSRRLRKSR